MPDEQEDRAPSELVETASAVGGALAGTALTLVAGPFVGSASGEAVARVLLRVGTEIERRLLAPRQEQRIAEAYETTASEIKEHLSAGETVRPEVLTDDPDGAAAELLEGTLRTAGDAWERRKVPYIARIFARWSFDLSISASEANYLLKLADRLTYRQVVLLAFWSAAEPPDGAYTRDLQILFIERSERGGSPTPTILAEMDELGDVGLLGIVSSDEQIVRPGGTWGSTGGFNGVTDIDRVRLTEMGRTLHRLMGLDQVPDDDLCEVLRAIRGTTVRSPEWKAAVASDASLPSLPLNRPPDITW